MHEIDRRRFLRMAGLAGLALTTPAILAACGGDDDDTPSPTTAGNGDPSPSVASSGELESTKLKVGYLPITDATPLLIAHANGYYKEAGLEVENPTLFRSWPAIAEAFQARQVDIVHMLMPTTVFMRFGQQVPVKVVAWNHMDGSGLTVANDINTIDDLIGGTIAIPSYYSIHNVTLQALLREAKITPVISGNPSASNREVKLVVMAPPDMPPAIANGSIGGYIVAEPFNAAAEVNDVGKMLRFTGDIWQNHACCVAIMHEDAIAERPNWAQATVSAIARAQLFANENREETARILSNSGDKYLPQPLEVIDQAMNHYDKDEYGGEHGAIQHPEWPNERIAFQPFPFASYTEELVRLMKETVVEGDAAFLADLDPVKAHQELVEDKFARTAIQELGGAAKFGIPESLTRQEIIEP
ncbi:MAG: ABC transporter substrate-binding protein [Dehalococcoidia bacterium]|nr:ABC transporter substrate-binding protein [Dehalococcoidia bacterium]